MNEQFLQSYLLYFLRCFTLQSALQYLEIICKYSGGFFLGGGGGGGGGWGGGWMGMVISTIDTIEDKGLHTPCRICKMSIILPKQKGS